MVQFASYLRRVLHKTRLIFPRINGPIDYIGLRQSSFKLTITLNARHREHLKAFANSCKDYKINEHSRNTSGVLSVTFDHYH